MGVGQEINLDRAWGIHFSFVVTFDADSTNDQTYQKFTGSALQLI